ncbi:MAG: WD40 repeat domain-containing protein, partial [Beijerinckiaceae bacterium]
MSSPVSLLERVQHRTLGAHALTAGFIAETPVFALVSGDVVFGEATVAAQPAGILVAAMAGNGVVTGGEDGRVLFTSTDGDITVLGETGGAWVDALTLGADNAVAWSAGKQVTVRDGKGNLKSWAAPSSVRGLAFLPKGYRLVVAHYNGASLWFPNTTTAPDALNWKGAHIDAAVSPDGRFVVTSMQENALHGWRIADKAHMRMTGYPAKTRSMSWSHDGAWLATSGAEAAIIWPFGTKDGPMGKAPRECGVRPARVSQ